MERYILDDGYNVKGRKKPIEYVIEGDCFICVSHAVNTTGYIRTKRFYKNIDMHVWINNVFNEVKSQKGMVVRHLCNNKLCINPKHLKVGTYKENEKDKVLAGTNSIGERHGMCKLNESKVREIKKLLDKNNNADLSKIFKVNKNTIRLIRIGETWKHVV